MLAKVLSAGVLGLDARLIEVEVDIPGTGLPTFTIVGLPDKAVEESRERVRSAIKNSGANFPGGRITVNLAPADLPKMGPAYDLPIAIGILIASGQINPDIKDSLFIGELSLDGNLRHTSAILPVTYHAAKEKVSNIFVPESNAKEASIVPNITVYPTKSLTQVYKFFTNTTQITPCKHSKLSSLLKKSKAEFDFFEIVGQEQAKRAAEIAAAGGHNMFLRGVPGSGKTMIARSISGILPILTEEEALEVTKIYSVTGNLSQGESIITTRPFRSPHHTTSRIGLIGGGANPTPGEISLSHRGVLFLDEFPEFPRNVLESLRQPIEDGIVSISRAKASVSYPAKFLLIAAANPCPCGYHGDQRHRCKCTPGQISRYEKKISGPLLDRIDIHIEVTAVSVKALTAIKRKNQKIEKSKSIQKRVQLARDMQSKRFIKTNIKSNCEMNTRQVKKFCRLDPKSRKLLVQAVTIMGLSARSYFKMIKVARTIADLANEVQISQNHIAEALQYRPKDLDQ